MEIKLPASMQERTGRITITVPDNPLTTVAELIKYLEKLPEFEPLIDAYRKNPKALMIICDKGRVLTLEDRLDDCDYLWLFYPAKGGS